MLSKAPKPQHDASPPMHGNVTTTNICTIHCGTVSDLLSSSKVLNYPGDKVQMSIAN